MDHETAATLLTDLGRGLLNPQDTAEIAAHVASCSECREVAETLPRVREALWAHGGALFEPHPGADELARYALSTSELDTAALVRIGAHVRACPTCGQEVDVARRAGRSTWLRAPQAWLRAAGPTAPAALVRPALAALALLLVYPAYVGLVTYPEARRAVERAADQAEALRRSQTDLRQSLEAARAQLSAAGRWSGGVPLLTLAGPSRGGAESTPAIRLRPGQPYQPVLVAYEPPFGPRDPDARRLELRLRAEERGATVWQHVASLEELWDPESQGLSLLVPTELLTPGAYRLELRWGTAPGPLFSASFRVLAGVER